MKKILSIVLSLLMIVSVLMTTACMNETDSYSKTEVDGFVENLKLQITSKNDAALAEISGLKAIYEAKVALLENADADLKAELKALTDAYNAKTKERQASACRFFVFYRLSSENIPYQ